ncbi:type II toxin-antitoxin system YoeB family toxin [Verrucosispora sp. WMMD573]|uniref:type II toxin-antitoxin system YoeB family toxin n=1 Tax=Verrucosispora sp. WMMD573 TaxID=3015149 RepID=UPI00248CE63B|nr:type II toxin-antitoxin system YoeB family toxin [Verrucosispora sp. WMMD573]WBB55990.1 type II toxin-antitoxin system YoeB family toxin [Verrucosispora sp. WMMD573]
MYQRLRPGLAQGGFVVCDAVFDGGPLSGQHGSYSSEVQHRDREHRLVYRITKDDIEIVACRYHYGDR